MGDKIAKYFVFINILLLVFSATPILAACPAEKTIDLNVSTADGTGNYASVKPGDTICISSGTRQKLVLKNFTGLPGSPITFINSGGQVFINNNGFAGIEIQNSEHIHLTGTGLKSQCGAQFSETSQECGLVINSSSAGTAGRGIAGTNKVSFIEIDHVEVGQTGESGFTIKTNEFTRDEFTQYDTFLHHNYVHDTTIDEGSEGFYIGSSDYSTAYLPLLKGVEISYNLVARTGWDGIQVGSAVERCTIHHNKIYTDSLSLAASQQSGMMINRGSVCDVYNNFLKDGYAAYGIYVQGNGGNHIYNNIIVNRTTNSGGGIKISTGSNTGQSIVVLNNTLVNIQDKGINFSNTYGNDNRIQNNIIVNTATPLSAGIAANNNNITGTDLNSIGAVKFKNPASDDYSLLTGSPAIDQGLSAINYGVNKDFIDTSRPQGPSFDIGAYEFVSNVTPKPGDANGDNQVDGIDYVVWLNHYGQSVSGSSNGDFDNNGNVDGVDYVIWLNNFGK